MKFRVTFKTPDVVDYSLEDLDITREEKEAIYDRAVSQWFRYGEYATIEVNTDANTAVVISNT